MGSHIEKIALPATRRGLRFRRFYSLCSVELSQLAVSGIAIPSEIPNLRFWLGKP